MQPKINAKDKLKSGRNNFGWAWDGILKDKPARVKLAPTLNLKEAKTYK